MFKYKKILLNIICIIFMIVYFIEFIKYLLINSNIYGIYYLLVNLVIIFFLIPVTYNYKRHYSKARISKIFIIILLGIFNSFFLEMIVINNLSVMDSSKDYIDGIFVIKNIIKPILYVLLIIFIILETKAYLLLKKIRLLKSKKTSH